MIKTAISRGQGMYLICQWSRDGEGSIALEQIQDSLLVYLQLGDIPMCRKEKIIDDTKSFTTALFFMQCVW
jgi:hypothetical protein